MGNIPLILYTLHQEHVTQQAETLLEAVRRLTGINYAQALEAKDRRISDLEEKLRAYFNTKLIKRYLAVSKQLRLTEAAYKRDLKKGQTILNDSKQKNRLESIKRLRASVAQMQQ